MSGTLIRAATRDDLPGVLALYRHLHDEPEPDPAAAESAWSALLCGPGRVIVAEATALLVSTCALAINPNLSRGARPYGVIENVVTHPDHRGLGLGRAVLHAAIRAAWDAGCYKVMLATGARCAATLRFYEGAGFGRGAKTYFEVRRGGRDSRMGGSSTANPYLGDPPGG